MANTPIHTATPSITRITGQAGNYIHVYWDHDSYDTVPATALYVRGYWRFDISGAGVSTNQQRSTRVFNWGATNWPTSVRMNMSSDLPLTANRQLTISMFFEAVDSNWDTISGWTQIDSPTVTYTPTSAITTSNYGKLTTPSSFMVTAGDAQVGCSWVHDGTNVNGWNIELQSRQTSNTWSSSSFHRVVARLRYHAITHLTNNTTYRFRIQALAASSSVQMHSDYTPWIEQTPIASAPTSKVRTPTSVNAAVGDGQTIVTWSSSLANITGYRVQWREQGASRWFGRNVDGGSTLTHTISNLRNGITYQVRVRATTNRVGYRNSDYSSIVSVVPSHKIATPVLTSVTAGNGYAVINWTESEPAGVGSWTIEWKYQSATQWESIVDNRPTDRTYRITPLGNGSVYQFRIRANPISAAYRTSDYSNVLTATPRAPQAVAAPTNITYTAGNAQVAITWSYSGSNHNGFEIDYRLNTVTSWTTISITNQATRNYTITGLTNASTYKVRMRATADSTSYSSSAYTFATDVTPIRAVQNPSNLTGTGGDGQVVLNWEYPSSEETYITAFGISYGPGGALTNSAPDAAKTARTATITGLTNGRSYTFQIFARGISGYRNSGWSNAVNVTPNPIPDTPVATPGAFTATRGDRRITASWTHSGTRVSSFTLRYRVQGTTSWTNISNIGSTVRSRAITGLTNGTTYELQVRAETTTDGYEESAWTSSATATPAGTVATPVLSATAIVNGIETSWTHGGDGVSSWCLEYRLGSVGSFTRIAITSASTRSYTIRNLQGGETYQVRLLAMSTLTGWANSAYTSVISVTTDQPAVADISPTTSDNTVRGALWGVITDADDDEALGMVRLTNVSINATTNAVSQVDIGILPNERTSREVLRWGRHIRIYIDWPHTRLLMHAVLQQQSKEVAADSRQETWQCVDFLDELRQVTVGLGYIVDNVKTSRAINDLLLFVPGWAVKVTGDDPVISFRSDGESVLDVLTHISELANQHFITNHVTRQIIMKPQMGEDTGIVIRQESHLYEPTLRNPLIVSVNYTEDTLDFFNRIVPYSGNPNLPLTLEKSTLDSPYHIKTKTTPDGRTLHFLEDEQSIRAYGEREITKAPSYLLYPREEITTRDGQLSANALYLWAQTELLRHKEPQRTYEISVNNLLIHNYNLGDSVRVIYHGIANERNWLDIDEHLTITDINQTYSPDERNVHLTLTNNGSSPLRPDEMLAEVYKGRNKQLAQIEVGELSGSADFELNLPLEYDDEGNVVEQEEQPPININIPGHYIEIIQARLFVTRADVTNGPAYIQAIWDETIPLLHTPLLQNNTDREDQVDIWEFIKDFVGHGDHSLRVVANQGTGKVHVSFIITGTLFPGR